MALHNIGRFGAITVTIAGLGGLLAACAPQGAPLALACEPNQRAIVRQVTVNGVPQAQLECTSSPAPVPAAVYGTGVAGAVQPAAYDYSPTPIADTQFVRAAYQPAVVTQRVPARRVVAPKRSVAKSAVIIGSSAGVGAGIGAAFGGKKGAGIGALVGGGGAALWDQLTRRR